LSDFVGFYFLSILRKEDFTMRKFKMMLVLSLILSVLSASQVFGAGKFTYTSGFQVQDLSGAGANVTISYYDQDGAKVAEGTDTIAADSSATYFPIDSVGGTSLGLTSFNGSIVVSADNQVGAVVNVLSSDFSAAASYVGSSAGATSVQLPLLMQGNSGFDTWFNVQNTGTDTANVTVSYSDGTSATASVAAGSAATFDQATESHSSAVFSADITSDQPIVAAAMQESSTVMFAYSGFTGGVTNPVMPLVNANNANFITGIQIQNAGDTDTEVTLSYTPAVFGGTALGTACTETQTIASGASGTFALFAFNSVEAQANTSTTCTALERFVGSAVVTANTGATDGTAQPLAAIANQLSGSSGEAYNGFDASAATSSVVMPLIMDRNSGYYTGFNLMNVGTTDATVSCSFSNNTATIDLTLAVMKLVLKFKMVLSPKVMSVQLLVLPPVVQSLLWSTNLVLQPHLTNSSSTKVSINKIC
jgi:hypothetical protein